MEKLTKAEINELVKVLGDVIIDNERQLKNTENSIEINKRFDEGDTESLLAHKKYLKKRAKVLNSLFSKFTN